MKIKKRVIFVLGSLFPLSLLSCSSKKDSSSNSEISSGGSIASNDSSKSSSKENEPIVSSESSKENGSVTSQEKQEPIEYEEVVNTSWPEHNKTYRVSPSIVTEDEFTVFNVQFDTEKYLAKPTTLTIKKSDYCLTYETVALYYMAFRTTPPNYVRSKNQLPDDPSYRLISTYTGGSYTGSNSYTESLGRFNNLKGTYLELDIALSSSYGKRNRGAGRVVVVTEGIDDCGNDPVCYFTKDHYSHFSEFYNYATGWGPLFLGAGQASSPRRIPTTVTPIF